MNSLISVIVSTYNWPQALNLCLKSLSEQTDRKFEVVVADDGSSEDTKKIVDFWKEVSPFPVIHSWQEDLGFRLARSRNLAVSRSHGKYLIFLDGDCFVKRDFVAFHRNFGENGYVLAGQRILLSESFTQQCLMTQEIAWRESLRNLLEMSKRGQINRFLPAVNLPFECLQAVRSRNWKLLRGCNWSLMREDYMAVKGQDELYEGWGYEDSDMAIRLLNNGCSIKKMIFSSPCFHMWHKSIDKVIDNDNIKRLEELLLENRKKPKKSMFS